MSAHQLSLASDAEGTVRDHEQEPNSGRNIAMKVDIHADTRRIFLALVEPEYRELWMRFPGQDQGGRLAASQAGDLFRLDYYQAGKLDLSIVGAYRTCRWRKIVCSWWTGIPKSPVSSVEFHLDGSFENSLLRLNHRGLVAEREYLWHREMWRLSLAKLQCIF
jgi:uncharacterized protein YndB with AHSA1/START domain